MTYEKYKLGMERAAMSEKEMEEIMLRNSKGQEASQGGLAEGMTQCNNKFFKEDTIFVPNKKTTTWFYGLMVVAGIIALAGLVLTLGYIAASTGI